MGRGSAATMMTKRVLIAEDDPDTRFLLSLVLKEQGYDVVSARDGVEAVALAQKNPPDLIVVDQMMPRMTGSDCVATLRADPTLCRAPVVMVTAAAGLVRGTERLRFDAVVEKPVELETFVRTVRALCPPGTERRVASRPCQIDRRLGPS
jgi:CheY-like chemotaxis protein